MKWTEQQIEELNTLCYKNVPNNELAKHFNVPVNEIHAKRSQLAITIPKIRAAQGKPGMTVNPEFEAAVQEMEKTLKPRLPKAIKKAFDDLGTAILLKMAGDYTSTREAKVYCAMAEELISLESRYAELLEAVK